MPNVLAAYADELLKSGADPDKLRSWIIDFVDPGSPRGAEFTDRQKKQETDMLRAWLVPERAATEGTHGTKAEAEAHGALIPVMADVELKSMLDYANKGIVDQQLALNFGIDAIGAVTLDPEPVQDEQKALVREIAKALFGAPNNADLTLETLDVEKIVEILGLPPAPEMADAINRHNEAPAPIVVSPVPPEPEPEPQPEPDKEAEMSLPETPEDGDVAWLDTIDGRQYYVATGGNWKTTTLSLDNGEADTEAREETD